MQNTQNVVLFFIVLMAWLRPACAQNIDGKPNCFVSGSNLYCSEVSDQRNENIREGSIEARPIAEARRKEKMRHIALEKEHNQDHLGDTYQGLSLKERKAIQQRLLERSFYKGKVDGVYGAKTLTALDRWAKSRDALAHKTKSGAKKFLSALLQLPKQDQITISQSDNGHFYVSGQINDAATIRFLVDTGATEIVLSPEDAKVGGIDINKLNYNTLVQTANGLGLIAEYWIDNLTIEKFNIGKTKLFINRTAMSDSLLGMSFLGRLSSFRFEGNKLILTQE